MHRPQGKILPSEVRRYRIPAVFALLLAAAVATALLWAADQFGSPPSNSYTDSISPSQPSTGSSAGLEFTPKIAGYWSVSTSCTVTVTDTKNNEKWSGSANCGPDNLTSYTLDITYTGPVVGQTNPDSGTVVTNGQSNVHAGWPIQLGAVLAPSDLAGQFTWTIQGAGGNGSAAIGGYNPTTDATQVVTLDPATVTAAALTTYYYTESGTFNASLSPQGENISAKTTFIVTKPKIRISTQTPVGVAIGQFKISGLNVYGVGFGQPITVKNNDSGIYFSNDDSLPTQFAGKLGWAQVYQPNRTYTTAGGTVYHLNQPGLDTQFPYQNDGSARNPVAQDLPAQGVAGVQVTINDKATMWMIYQPSV